MDAQQHKLDGVTPRAGPGSGGGPSGGGAAAREEGKPRVDAALQELRRGVGREGNPARAALAVWELLDETRRGKQAGKRTAREKKRGGGGFRLGGARDRAL